MSDALERIGALVARRFGLRPALGAGSHALGPTADDRARARGLALDAYAWCLERDVEEQWALASALSNGWTWFFRDREQLETLVRRLSAGPHVAPLSIWVAGCSTGEEAYSLAMICAEHGLDVRITATDLSRARLETLARGIYDDHALRAASAEDRARWLEPLVPGSCRVREELRRVVEPRLHNLVEAPPARSRFDAVVCRNVLIHATEDGAVQMLRGLTGALAPGGELVLGASDLFQAPLTPAILPMPAPRDVPPRSAPSRATETVDAVALVTMGNLCVEAHAFDRAEAAYRRAETLDPCSAELHLAWGVLHRKRGDVERALSALRRAVFLDETLWPAWALLAGVLARLGADRESERASCEARRAQRERPLLEWRSHTGRLLREQLASRFERVADGALAGDLRFDRSTTGGRVELDERGSYVPRGGE